MKGDFSRWDPILDTNVSGVLHQQGRVSLDRDPNDQARLTLDWQDEAARQIIGPDVAAIPADAPDSFKISEAALDNGTVLLGVLPGHGWADGLAVALAGNSPDPGAPAIRTATYLEPPIQDPPGDVAGIGDGVRDAVVLEVWREALNAFQVPEQLIEAALGGPDTTERVLTAMRFRLFRLADGDTCETIGPRLRDNFAAKGKLAVTLQPTTVTVSDCPVVEGGGYTGFEHFLYRIEIALMKAAPPMFKWSPFNGGLVGRGECDLPNKKIMLTANDQAIKMSGLSEFYLEAVEWDADQGCWRVTYGADVTLNGDQLEIINERYTETGRPSGRVFFRLWNGIFPVSEFLKPTTPAEPVELRDGIRLAFDAPASGNYTPGDYWTFPVRAGEIGNPETLIADQPPDGVHYHRVPLAILNWDADHKVSFDEGQIDDCRDGFDPLTKQRGCCSYQVGDGTTSFGDYNSIEAALLHLPPAGGEICLLPGFHEANVVIDGRRNIKISGCDLNTRVSPRSGQRTAPIFLVRDSQIITLTNMDLVTFEGSAVVLEGTKPGLLREIDVAYNHILAFLNAIHVLHGQEIHLHHNQIRMLDRPGGDVAIFLQAEDGLVERNDLFVIPAGPPPGDPTDPDTPPDPTDPCTDPEIIYCNRGLYATYLNYAWLLGVIPNPPANPYVTLGGIQVGSGSERIKIWENRIQGGASNGITLGSDLDPADLAPSKDAQDASPSPELTSQQNGIWGSVSLNGQPRSGIDLIFEPKSGAEPSHATTIADGTFVLQAPPGGYHVSTITAGYRVARVEMTIIEEFGEFHQITLEVAPPDVRILDVLAFLYEIAIERNEISLMGLSGIGTPAVDVERLIALTRDEINRAALALVFLLLRLLGGISGFVNDLEIRNNRIFRCLLNPPEPPALARVAGRGQGGIALLLVQNGRIDENRIEANGRDHLAPICGVYIAWAEQVGLSHNQILNNGPLSLQLQRAPSPGLRGGIVVRLASTFALPTQIGGLGQVSGGGTSLTNVSTRAVRPRPSAERHALRVHDNLVQHPVGRALTVQALGPLSIQNNQFFTDQAGNTDLDRLAGAVLITDLGRSRFLQTGALLGEAALPVTTARAIILPGGDVLFANNQTQLGESQKSLISQLILTADDLGFHGNQSDVLVAPALWINTVLLAPTVRANDNRLQEPIQPRRS